MGVFRKNKKCIKIGLVIKIAGLRPAVVVRCYCCY